jgi:hypothetical protein
MYSSLIGWIADTQSNEPHAKRHRQTKLFSARRSGIVRRRAAVEFHGGALYIE